MTKTARGRAGAKSRPAAKTSKKRTAAKRAAPKPARKAATKKPAAAKKAPAKKASAKKATKKASRKTATKRVATSRAKPVSKTVPAKKSATAKQAKKSATAKAAKKSATAKAAQKSATAKAAKKSATAKAARKSAPATTAKKPAKKASPAPVRALAEARPDEALVDRTMALLDAHDRSVADSMREIGEHLLAEYFGGDEELARSRVAAKPLSYERLASRAELETSWDAADLRRAVTAALVHGSLPSALADRVPGTYLVRLDSVDDPSERASLAARIADGELRGHAAKEAITLASVSIRRGGRPKTPGPLRLANALERLFERADDFAGLDPTAASELDELERAALAGRLDDAARRLTALAARVRTAR